MRIEYQGTIEVRPPYQHVGYTAACVLGSEYRRLEIGDMVGSALAILGLALALASIRGRGTGRLKALTLPAMGVLTVGAVVAFCCGTSTAVQQEYLSPRFAATLVTIERLTAQTDVLVAQLRRVPSEEEWQAAVGEPRDAWGQRIAYHAPPTWKIGRDARGYEILSTNGGGRPRPGGAMGNGSMVLSTWLGSDGRIGTADDYAVLAELLRRCRVRSRPELEAVAAHAPAALSARRG